MLSSPWLVFALLFTARTSIAFQFQSVAAVGPLLIEGLVLDFLALGLLIAAHLLPGAVLALPAGLLAQRLGPKHVVIAGLLLMVLGGAFMALGPVSMLFAGRIASGVGAVILNVLLPRMVLDWFSSRDNIAVMGALAASWPLGIALALVVLPTVAEVFGWRSAMLAAAVPSLICLALMLPCYDDRRSFTREASSQWFGISPREAILVCLAGLIWGAYNASYVVFVSTLPDIFVLRGYSLSMGAFITSLFGWALIATLPLGGYLANKVRRPSATMIACLIVCAVAAGALAFSDGPMLSFIILVVAIGLPAGLMMALPSEVLAPERRSAGMGLFFTLFYLAMAVLTPLAGLIRERTGDVGSSLLAAAAMLILAAAGLSAFAAMRRRAFGGLGLRS